MTTVETSETDVHGIGQSIKRKEDDRFIQGKGTYVEDLTLPNMLHMAILRSPFAHARIVSVNVDEAQAMPGVVAVVTGELLAQHNLAWMPTMRLTSWTPSPSCASRTRKRSGATVPKRTCYACWSRYKPVKTP